MISWIFIGSGITIVFLYCVFYKISKHYRSNIILIENDTNDTEIPPSYEEAVQNR